MHETGAMPKGNAFTDHTTMKPFRNMMLIVTEGCNLRCSYCYEKGYDYDINKTMPWEIAKESVDFFFQQIPPQEQRSCLLFFGGEPHLAFDLIRQVVDYSYAHRTIGGYAGPGHNYIVNTNGTMLNEEMYELYKGLGKKVKVLISVDGYEDGHDKSRRLIDHRGSWSLLAANLLRYRELREEHGVKIGLIYTINKSNYTDIYQNYIQLYKMTGVSIGSLFVHEDKWTSEDFAIIKEQVGLLYGYCSENDAGSRLFTPRRASNKAFQSICAAGIGSFAVNYRGDIYPCHRCYYNEMANVYKLGDIRNGIISSQRALIDEINSISKLSLKCRECHPVIWRRCHFCFAANKTAYGDFHRLSEDYCSLQKELHCTLSGQQGY